MKIAIGSDHAGFTLKEVLKNHLQIAAYVITDVGCFSSESVDFPDYAHQVAKLVEDKAVDFGVIICGSGQGVCIAANRHKGVRALLLRSEEDAKLGREHNNGNVACFGARMTDEKTAQKLLKIFLETKFAEGRHSKRVEKIDC